MKRILKLLALTVMVLFFLVPHFTVVSHAEDGKTIMVPVNKNYKAARFTLTFEYYDDYVVFVKSPSGKEYKGVILSGNEVEAVVNDVEVGQWEVHINYPDVITSEEAPSESSEGEGDSIEETVQRKPIILASSSPSNSLLRSSSFRI